MVGVAALVLTRARMRTYAFRVRGARHRSTCVHDIGSGVLCTRFTWFCRLRHITTTCGVLRETRVPNCTDMVPTAVPNSWQRVLQVGRMALFRADYTA